MPNGVYSTYGAHARKALAPPGRRHLLEPILKAPQAGKQLLTLMVGSFRSYSLLGSSNNRV